MKIENNNLSTIGKKIRAGLCIEKLILRSNSIRKFNSEAFERLIVSMLDLSPNDLRFLPNECMANMRVYNVILSDNQLKCKYLGHQRSYKFWITQTMRLGRTIRMATYIQNKSSAFLKINDAKSSPQKKRSDGRLKKYSSTTDSRAWANNAFDKKAFMMHIISRAEIKQDKYMGEIIPIEFIWKVLMMNKNNYISDLEERIQCFVDLLQRISLSTNQMYKIRHLCMTTFQPINEYLSKYKLSQFHFDDIEKSIQVVPATKNSNVETEIITNNSGINTVFTDVYTRSTSISTPAFKSSIHRAIETIRCPVSDVALQVVMALPQKADKCVFVKVRASSQVITKKSTSEKSTKVSLERLNKNPIKKNQKHYVTKSQSAIVCTRNVSTDAISSAKPGKSCVSFSSKIDSFPILDLPSEGSKPEDDISTDTKRNNQAKCEKAFDSTDSINPITILEEIIATEPTRKSTISRGSGEIIEVVSECEQTSFTGHEELSASVIQLYKSTKKSSLDSTIMKEISVQETDTDIEDKIEEVDEYDSDRSNQDVAVSTPDFGHKNYNKKNQKLKYSASKEVSREISTDFDKVDWKSTNYQCAYSQVGDGSDTNEVEFKDCATPINAEDTYGSDQNTGNKTDQQTNVVFKKLKPGKQDQETNVVSCIHKKKIGPPSTPAKHDHKTNVVSSINKERQAYLDRRRENLLKIAECPACVNKDLADYALNYLESVKKTLLQNKVMINLAHNLPDQHKSFDNETDSTAILHQELLLIEKMCHAIIKNECKLVQKRTLVVNHSTLVDIVSLSNNNDKTKTLQINIEHQKLHEHINKLEDDLKIFSNIKYEIIQDPKIANISEPRDILKEICELKRRVVDRDELERELIYEKYCVASLKDNLSTLSANKFNEYEALRYKAQEADILKLQVDRLQLQLHDVQKLQADNINLHNQCTELRKQLKQFEKPLPQSRFVSGNTGVVKALKEEVEKLKEEKNALGMALINKECGILDQEEQIERLIMHIDRLTTTNEKNQEKYKQIVCQLRADISMKNNYIVTVDDNLELVGEKLKESISSISKDSNLWQNKLNHLEKICCHLKTKNDTMQDTIDSLQKQLELQKETNKAYSLELQKKERQLHKLMQDSNEEIFGQKMVRVNKLETILQKSHNAVQRVVEELSKQYGCELRGIPELLN